MVDRPSRLLRPPEFEDRDLTRRAALLYRFLLLLLFVAMIMTLITLHPAMSSIPDYAWATNASMALLILPAMWAVRRGYVRTAGMGFAVAMWLAVSGATLVMGGVQGPMALAYMVVGLMAGFFWGGRAMLGFTVATSAVAAAMVLLDANEMLPTPIAVVTPANTWMLLTAAMTVSALLLEASQRAMREAIVEAQRSETDALRAQSELEAGRSMLETRERQQAALAELGQRALGEASLEELVDSTCSVITDTLEIEQASVLELMPHGRSFELVVGKGWGELPDPRPTIPATPDTLAGVAIATGEPVVAEDIRATDAYSGSTLLHNLGIVSAVVVPVSGTADVPFGVLGAFDRNRRAYTDDDVQFMQAVANLFTLVLRRTAADRELRQRNEELRQAHKMEAVGRFAGGIAHDFNNLLMAITGYNRFLLRDLPEHGPEREAAGEIQRAADRAAALTSQILAFSRRQVLEPRVLDLNDVIDDTRKMLERVIGEDVQLVTSLARDLDAVYADPGQIEQVLLNLVLNARDALPRGGLITIETRNQTIPESATADSSSILAPGAHVELIVTDDGVGMDPETREQIFEPFFTTKGRMKGTGLGLATVYGIVSQSGGDVRVESELGRGASFHILLPRSDAEVTAKPVPTPEPSPRGHETILLAEDDPTVRRLVERILVEHGYRVLVAEDGARALALARDYEAPIHLLISDVIMPEVSGGELMERLKELHPESRVLFISGHADDQLARHGVASSGSAFLAKPFGFDEFVFKVRETLDLEPRKGSPLSTRSAGPRDAR